MPVGAESLALVNANVRTLDVDLPRAQAVLSEAGVITAVGSSEQVARAAGDRMPVVDCRGATVLPGFVDGHCHFELTCVSMDRWINVHTPPHQSLESVERHIRDALAKDTGRGWVLCRSSFAMHEKVVEKRLFSRRELDAIESRRPLAVFASLHVASLNTAAFERLGLWEASAVHPFHGVVHRDRSGQPTGVVTEVFMMVPSPGTDEQFVESVRTHARSLFNAAGTTTVCTMPESLQQIRLLRELHDRDGLGVRHRYYVISPGVASLDEADELRRTDSVTHEFRYGGIKVFVNGCAHDGLGLELDDPKWTQDSLDEFVHSADARGHQVWMHSLNARGVRMAARAILRVAPHGGNPRRHRIEHGADFIDLADLELVRRSGAVLVTTPQFLHSMTTDPSGPSAPLRTLQLAGVRVLGGTDSTGTVPASVSILGNVGTAVTRRRNDGSTFRPREAIDPSAALDLFSRNAAWGTFQESSIGTISPGKHADLVVLDDDPIACRPSRISGIRARATYLAGRQVWG